MRLRFTIRDLLWLTLVVALAVGWFVNRTHFKLELAAKDHQINDLERDKAQLLILTAPQLDIPNQSNGSGIIRYP